MAFNSYWQLLGFNPDYDSDNESLVYLYKYLETFGSLPLDEGLNKSLILKTALSDLSCEADIQYFISDFEHAYFEASRSSRAFSLFEPCDEAKYILSREDEWRAKFDVGYALRQRQRLNIRRRAAFRKVSRGFSSRNGKPAITKHSNCATGLWRQANWLNVRLGCAKASVDETMGALKKSDRRLVKAVCSRVFAKVCADWQAGDKIVDGKLSRNEKRHMREVLQRAAARARDAKAFKAKHTKEERERLVKAARDKRSGVIDFVEQSSRTIQDVCVATTVGVASAVVAYKLMSTFKKADDTFTAITTLTSAITGLVDTLKKHLGAALWAVPFAVIAYKLVSMKGVRQHLLYIPFVAVLAKFFGPKLWKYVSEFFHAGNGTDTLEFQSGIADVLPRLLSIVMVASAFDGKFSQSRVTECMKRVCMVERASTGWDSILTWVLKAIEVVVNYFRELFGKERVALIKDSHGPARQWFKAVDSACESHDTADVVVDSDELDRLISLIQEGHKYKDLYRGTDMEKPVAMQLAKIVNVLQPHLGAVTARNNFRMEPVACMFLGDPGIGKTRMAPAICAAILMGSGLVEPGTPPTKVAAEIFQKGISEYWNGYSKQKCLVMDDAFQPRANTSDQENEYMTLIRMVCPWSFPLNFADLASKGKIFFDSKFIFGTTNVASIYPDAIKVIHEPSAVTRRLHYSYKVVLKKQYANAMTGRLDDQAYVREVALCAGKRGYDAYPFHMWNVYKHDFLTGRTDETPCELRDLVAQMAEDLRTRLIQHNGAKDEFNNLVAAFSRPQAVEVEELPREEEFEFLPTIIGDIPEVSVAEFQSLRSIGAAAFACLRTAKDWVEDRYAGGYYGKDDLAGTMFCAAYLHYCREVGYVRAFITTSLTVLTTFLVVVSVRRLLRALIVGVYDLFAAVFGFRKDEADEQSNRPPSLVARGWRKPKVKLQAARKSKIEAVAQSIDTTVASNVYNNTYKVYVELHGAAKQIVGQVLFLTDTLAVQPAHFTNSMRTLVAEGSAGMDSKMVFRNAHNAQHTFTLSLGGYLRLQRHTKAEQDVEFVKFKDVRAHRNIVRSFVTEKDLNYVGGMTMRLDICEIDNRSAITADNRRQTYVLKNPRVGRDLGVRGRSVERYVKYDASTVQGDCGAPLCLFDASSFSGRTCVGFHVAGNSAHAQGFSAIITQEMITEGVKALDAIVDNFVEDISKRVEYQSGGELPFLEGGSFLSLGCVATPVNLCPKTSYYMVDGMYGTVGEYSCRPAPLSPVMRDGVLVYPMDNAVRPYSSPLLVYEQAWLDQAVHQAFVPLDLHTAGCSRRIYTFEEAVVGVPEEKFRGIPRGTAAGFPYVYDVRDGKKEFFGAEGDYDLTTEKCDVLRQRVDEIIESAARGERLAHVFVDFLKDELRSQEKVEKVATRLISSAPLDYVVAWRSMFGAFSAAVMRNHTAIGMAPGICVYSDWGVLAQQLQVHGDKVFDGDFKAFDSSEQPTIHRLILDRINAWYDDGPRNKRIREVLWLDLCHSRHIGGRGNDQRYVYQWNKSLPSGHPFTTIINSLYSLTVLSACYIAATKDMTGFWRKVSPVTYGDDNAVNVSDDIADVYNQVEVARHMAEQFGLTYTPGRKDGVWDATTTLDKITFLKRGFSRVNNEWLCPLELESFLYTHYWCKNKKLEKRILRDVLDFALQELSMHSEEQWKLYAPTLYDLLGRYVTCPQEAPSARLDQGSYLRVIQSRTDSWY